MFGNQTKIKVHYLMLRILFIQHGITKIWLHQQGIHCQRVEFDLDILLLLLFFEHTYYKNVLMHL